MENNYRARTTRESVLAYIADGLMPLPAPRASKGCFMKGWPELRITKDTVDRYFNGADRNITVLMGEPSGNLIDIDLDCPETVALAPRFLPDTGMIFGRTSKRASHWIYQVDPLLKTKSFMDENGEMMVEFLSTGRQTTFPPSTHHSGEPVTFDHDGKPDHVDGNELLRCVVKLAVAALMVRHWPAEGGRHAASLALGGALIGAGWDEDDVFHLVETVAEVAGDEEAEQRANNVISTATRHEADEPITGLPTLAEIVGDKVTRKLRQWLGLGLEAPVGAAADGTVPDPVINELNQKHAVVMLGGKCRVMNEVYDPVLKRPMITFSTTSEFNAFHGNKHGPDGKLLGNYWLAHPNRRQYDGIVFDPEEVTDGRYYNLWRGFAVDAKEGDCQLYLDHVRDVIACGDEVVYNYIVACMADAVQNPAKRPGTAMVLCGKQGVGKGVFATEFGKLFGAHFVHVSHHRHLTGNFNSHLKDALVVFADEAFWAGDKSGEGVLKAMVTEDVLTVEFKGIDPIPVRNHIRLLVASNSDWVVPASLEERRFFVINVSDAKMQDRAYFGKLMDQMNSGGREALLAFLKDYDLSNVDLGVFPKTEALREQKIHSLPPIKAWWYDCLERGDVLAEGTWTKSRYVPAEETGDWTDPIPIQGCYQAFITHAKRMGVRHCPGEATFGKEMAKLVPGLVRCRPVIGDARTRCYQLPSLATCREEFNRLMQTPGHKWPEVGEEEEDGGHTGHTPDF